MAVKYWFGGAGTWDSTSTTHWSLTDGGPATTAVPGASDVATFNANSGGGTVIVDATVSNATIGGLTTSAFTGTINFSAVTALTIGANTWVDAATGAHTVTLGSGTFNILGTLTWTAGANFTFNAGTSTVVIASLTARSGSVALGTGGKTFNVLTLDGTNMAGYPVQIQGGPSIATLNILNSQFTQFASSTTTTVTNPITISGTSSLPVILQGINATSILKADGGASVSWGVMARVSFAGSLGGPVVATNTYDLGGNNMNGGSISLPSVGGGGGGEGGVFIGS
jgi:hypothetical protein